MWQRLILLTVLFFASLATAQINLREKMQLSEILKVRVKDHVLQFEQVSTGNPIVDDGSMQFVELLNIPGKTVIDRGPNSLAIHFEQAESSVKINPGYQAVTYTLASGPRVMLVQTIATKGAGTVVLRVWDKGAQGRVIVDVTEPSFADLCTKHPNELTSYVIPLFQQLDLGTLYVRPDDAARVFASQLSADPATAKSIEGLLPALNDDDATIRVTATRQLTALGPKIVPVLGSLDASHFPLQTRIALRDAVQPYATEAPEMKEPSFLILCLAADDPQVPKLAKAQLEKIRGEPVEFDLTAAVAARQAAALKLLLQ